MPIVSFKDFTPVDYAGGETEMQDRYALKRKRITESLGKIRERMKTKGVRRPRREREKKNDC